MQEKTNTEEVKKEVIKLIKKSKYILAKNFKNNWNKRILIERLNNFSLEDYKLYASDGNTEIHPDKYFKITLKEKLKAEYENHLFQMRFHEKDGEEGVNLLNCCNKCRDLFLRNTFEMVYYKKLLKGVA